VILVEVVERMLRVMNNQLNDNGEDDDADKGPANHGEVGLQRHGEHGVVWERAAVGVQLGEEADSEKVSLLTAARGRFSRPCQQFRTIGRSSISRSQDGRSFIGPAAPGSRHGQHAQHREGSGELH
jgi:hypothetical protein